ncbi:hypothetical protein G5B10_07635 [Fluviicola sp. SGL-29]|nr:hypothetical protein [Fluviicola sp. SGL-29]
MKIVIAYDVNRRNPEVKTALLAEGFHDRYRQNNITHYLADSTLWHQDLVNAERAQEIFEDIIRTLNENQAPENQITTTHFTAFEFTRLKGIPGEPHA